MPGVTDAPRIAQLANFVGPTSGGMRVALDRIGAGYCDHGAERLLIIPGAKTATKHTDEGTIVTVKSPMVMGGYRLIVDARPVVAALNEFEPTSIELSDKWTLLPVTTWARRRQIPTWLFSHERLDGMLPGRFKTQRRLGAPIAAYNAFLSRRVDGIIVTSEYAEGEFADVDVPVHRVPLGVDLQTFRPQYRESHTGPIRLVHFGRLSREKSPGLAIATAVELHQRGEDVRLDVYGHGPHLSELKAIAAGAPVTFRGFVSSRHELADAIAQADVSLSVCPTETFGLAVLEALACGTPVVTANTGGGSELVTPLCGASAAPNPHDLADAVMRVMEISYPERSKQARARAERFSWDTTTRRLLELHSGGRRDTARSA